MDKKITPTSTNISKGFWSDILTDNNSYRFSMTKVGSLIGLLMMFIVIMASTVIMVDKKEIDHVLIVEIIGFTLTAIGYKNGFGFNVSNKIGSMDAETINSINAINNNNNGVAGVNNAMPKMPSMPNVTAMANIPIVMSDMPPDGSKIEESQTNQ